MKSLIRASVLLSLAACATEPVPQIQISDATTFEDADFVDVATLAPGIVTDIRYAGSHNFVGEPVEGYEAPKCYLKRSAAQALARVERALRDERLRLKVFDCYRPARAVAHFVRWAEDTGDQRTKAEFYPRLDKSQLLGEYIAPVSGHSRGATIDVTLLDCTREPCQEADMGTPFDFFDVTAHTDDDSITEEQRKDRVRLRAALSKEGFENYPAEWWHYTYKPEPTPTVIYDIPVR